MWDESCHSEYSRVQQTRNLSAAHEHRTMRTVDEAAFLTVSLLHQRVVHIGRCGRMF
jgi:hypothetical protein